MHVLAEALHERQGGHLVVVEGADLDAVVELLGGVGALGAQVVYLGEERKEKSLRIPTPLLFHSETYLRSEHEKHMRKGWEEVTLHPLRDSMSIYYRPNGLYDLVGSRSWRTLMSAQIGRH